MRKIYAKIGIALILSGASLASMAQNSNVGIGTKSPDASAVLDIQSSERGLLIPRMTEAARDNISNPAEGLIVYQTDDKPGFYYFTQNSWKPLSGNEAYSVAADPNDWTIGGNTISAGNFIGSVNNVPLEFKVHNQRQGYLDKSRYSVFFGARAGEVNAGSFNVGFGYYALRSNTSGISNLALGAGSLENNTSGSNNVAIGSSTQQAGTTGNRNVSIGGTSLRSITTGNDNLAIGTEALRNITTGSGNMALGSRAGYSSVSGTNNVFLGNDAGFSETGSNKLYIASSGTATPLIYGDFSAKFVSIGDVDPAKRASANSSGGYNLLVKGGILTEKVKVALASSADWADYVFEPTYNLMSLEEVEKFTLENKHLPNVPSADEMAKDGLDINKTSKMFMEKIEELTLYMIELNKEIKTLKAENEVLKAQIK